MYGLFFRPLYRDPLREEILAPTAPRICSACPACLEECDPQEGPGHPLQSQAERNLLCRERATYLHSKQVAADGKSVRYGSVINCCNCRLYLAQGAGAGGPGHSSSMFQTDSEIQSKSFIIHNKTTQHLFRCVANFQNELKFKMHEIV